MCGARKRVKYATDGKILTRIYLYTLRRAKGAFPIFLFSTDELLACVCVCACVFAHLRLAIRDIYTAIGWRLAFGLRARERVCAPANEFARNYDIYNFIM